MSGVDFVYLGKAISDLSGVPVRVYQDGNELLRSFPVRLPKDPMELYKDDIFAITEHVGYIATPLFHYYGVLNAGPYRIVVGPTAQIMANERQLRELAFRLDVPKEEGSAFLEGMNAIVRLPVETLLQMLCTVNHLLNRGEKLKISDLAIHGKEQAVIKTGVEERRTARVYAEDAGERQAHNTLAIEDALMASVRRGDTAALKSWLSQAPAIQGGTIAKDQLRQLKTPSSSRRR